MTYECIDDSHVRLDSGETVALRFHAERLIGNAVMVQCMAECEGITCEARHTVAPAMIAAHGVKAWQREMMLRLLEDPPVIPEAAVDEHVRAAHSIRHALRIERELKSI